MRATVCVSTLTIFTSLKLTSPNTVCADHIVIRGAQALEVNQFWRCTTLIIILTLYDYTLQATTYLHHLPIAVPGVIKEMASPEEATPT